ncbi:unnamed protein product [Durusdinium trenchii]|uniref:Uncharacterized protein n=1 Tax=Durusdinium trenchii TaxID=1381693 RepID=A0ABP0JG85_9DINO
MRLDLWASTSPPVRTLKPPLFSTEAKSEGISLCILFVLSKMGVVDAISQSQEKLLLSFATEKEKLMLEKAESCGRRRRPSTEETCGGSIVGSSAGCVCVLWCQVIVGSRCGGCLKSLLLRVFNCFHLRRFVGMAT